MRRKSSRIKEKFSRISSLQTEIPSGNPGRFPPDIFPTEGSSTESAGASDDALNARLQSVHEQRVLCTDECQRAGHKPSCVCHFGYEQSAGMRHIQEKECEQWVCNDVVDLATEPLPQ